jgi:hypothetical protein
MNCDDVDDIVSSAGAPFGPSALNESVAIQTRVDMDELKKDGWSLNKDALLELGDEKTNFESAQDVLKLVLDVRTFAAPFTALL